MPQRPTLALVGGFLGAGKTTLILRAAEMLRRDGLRAAVITNDQDEGLVDTRLAEQHAFHVQEVAGACFCCRFSDLMEAAARLAAHAPDVIFAEPVGSCTDISATILQPLRAYYSEGFRVAPYTVLVDPERLPSAEGEEDIGFLFRNQIAEADILCLSKSDRQTQPPQLAVPVDFSLSAVTGEGVGEWLQEILHPTRVTGARILDIDYSRYAEAEAALGWLNVHADLALRDAASPAAVAGPLLDQLDERLTAAGIRIAHLKVFDRAGSSYIKAGICANGDEPVPEGDLLSPAAIRHELVVNLRALGEPSQLRAIVDETLSATDAEVTVRHANAFRPGAPKPEHRFTTTTL